MNDFFKKTGKKLFWIIISFILLEILLLLALEVIFLLSEYKLDISVDLILNEFTNMFSNIVSVIENYINERNPFLLLEQALYLYIVLF